MNPEGRHPASFRDPSGFLFRRHGTLLRQVNTLYQPDYESAERSGLFAELQQSGRLIQHEVVSEAPLEAASAWKVLRPEPLPFVSYPYEWCFSQLRDAALATLEIQRSALRRGMSLKDASAYNIQFTGGRPILVDTLSFEVLRPQDPWVAYRQFCQHFLAPLALMAHRDVRLGQLLRVHLDGIPLDLASRLLPRRTWAQFPFLIHLHLHAASQARFAGRAVSSSGRRTGMGLPALQGLIESLQSAIAGLRWAPKGTPWAEYQTEDSYSAAGAAAKHELVRGFLDEGKPGMVWDLGANTGVFSRLASQRGAFTVAWDLDASAVERNYLAQRAHPEGQLLPLLLDLTNPSPAIGWGLAERLSLFERAPADALLALALVHHLAIGNNVPLASVAAALGRMGSWLAIEFVPKSDPQVQRLLASRADVFPEYRREAFEAAFEKEFTIVRTHPIAESERTFYTMKAKR